MKKKYRYFTISCQEGECYDWQLFNAVAAEGRGASITLSKLGLSAFLGTICAAFEISQGA